MRILIFAPKGMHQQLHKYDNKLIEIITTDLNEKDVDMKADIQNLPFRNDYFDLILNSHVMEHIPNDSLAFAEQYRVMKEGATAIFQIPLRWWRNETRERIEANEAELKLWQYDHLRDYGLDFIKRAESAGFECRYVNMKETFTFAPGASYASIIHFLGISNEILVLCRKCY